jgi:hypothetical protein
MVDPPKPSDLQDVFAMNEPHHVWVMVAARDPSCSAALAAVNEWARVYSSLQSEIRSSVSFVLTLENLLPSVVWRWSDRAQQSFSCCSQ